MSTSAFSVEVSNAPSDFAGQTDTTLTELDLTVFVSSSDDSTTWISGGFPAPIPYTGGLCAQSLSYSVDDAAIVTASACLVHSRLCPKMSGIAHIIMEKKVYVIGCYHHKTAATPFFLMI